MPTAMPKWNMLLAVMFIGLVCPAQAFIEGLYCGTENCYEILDVTRSNTKGEITKAYRKLARKWHPDMHRKKEDKEAAGLMFQKIANAYEVLKDEEQRNDYNYMLDNPDEYYAHYFYYYRRRVAPKVDVRIVIAVTLTVISVIQYWAAWQNYNTAITYLATVPKYRLQAQDIARKQGLLNKKKDKTKTKEEQREEEENILKSIVEDKMDIRGGYQKPKITDVLWCQLVFFPYYLVMYMAWYLSWIWRFNIKREEYGDTEKQYIIRKFMKSSESHWQSLEDYEKEKYLAREL